MKAKEGRKIYLTLNSIKPPNIKMPQLINGSVKNAQLVLKTYDLLLGKINYVPDMAANAVIQQYYKDDIVPSGSLIPKGSIIDLDIGNGLGNQIFETPNLIGMDLEEVIKKKYGPELYGTLVSSTDVGGDWSFDEVKYMAELDKTVSNVWKTALPHRLSVGDKIRFTRSGGGGER